MESYLISRTSSPLNISVLFFIEVKGGTVLIHKNEKEFWFIIETNVRFFFSLLKSNFHNFFHYCENEKKDSRFPNQIYGLLKHIKRKLI